MLIHDLCFMLFSILLHIYLIKIGLKQQNLLRRYNHIQGHNGEILMLCIYSLYSLCLADNYFFVPFLRLLIKYTEYECSETIKIIWKIGYIITVLSIPLSAQIVFFALIRQLLSVKNKLNQTDNLTDDSEVEINRALNSSVAENAIAANGITQLTAGII